MKLLKTFFSITVICLFSTQALAADCSGITDRQLLRLCEKYNKNDCDNPTTKNAKTCDRTSTQYENTAAKKGITDPAPWVEPPPSAPCPCTIAHGGDLTARYNQWLTDNAIASDDLLIIACSSFVNSGYAQVDTISEPTALVFEEIVDYGTLGGTCSIRFHDRGDPNGDTALIYNLTPEEVQGCKVDMAGLAGLFGCQ